MRLKIGRTKHHTRKQRIRIWSNPNIAGQNRCRLGDNTERGQGAQRARNEGGFPDRAEVAAKLGGKQCAHAMSSPPPLIDAVGSDSQSIVDDRTTLGNHAFFSGNFEELCHTCLGPGTCLPQDLVGAMPSMVQFRPCRTGNRWEGAGSERLVVGILEMFGAPPAVLRARGAAQDEMVMGTPACPSVGSAGHWAGACRPCEYIHKGLCINAVSCKYCHLCGPEVAFGMRGVSSGAGGRDRGSSPEQGAPEHFAGFGLAELGSDERRSRRRFSVWPLRGPERSRPSVLAGEKGTGQSLMRFPERTDYCAHAHMIRSALGSGVQAGPQVGGPLGPATADNRAAAIFVGVTPSAGALAKRWGGTTGVVGAPIGTAEPRTP